MTYLHVIVKEDISQLEVPVDDLGLVDVLATEQNLIHEVSRLRLRDGLSPLVQLHQRPPPAQLEYNVHEIGVLEVGEKLDNIFMGERFVQDDLLRHLFTLVRLHEQRLGDDFAGEYFARREVPQLIAFRESALE